MNMITFTEGKPHRKSGVNSDRGTRTHIEIAATEVASNGGRLFFREIAWALIGTKRRGGCASECSIIVIILLVGQIRRLQSCIHWRRCKLNVGGC